MSTQATEDTIDLEALEKSASDLLASATAMSKAGFSMQNGTTFDERGQNAGSQSSGSDQGGVDTLQITGRAKYAKALKAGGYSDEEVGKMVAKMFGEKDDEEDEAKKSASAAATLAKSVSEATAQHGAPVSIEPILRDLLASTANAIDSTRERHGAFAKSQSDFNMKLSKAVLLLGRELRQANDKLSKATQLNEKLARKLDITIEDVQRAPIQPAGKLGTGQPMAKSNADGTPITKPGQLPEKLTAKQVASVMSYMGIEKGITDIGPDRTLVKSSLIVGGGSIERELYDSVYNWLVSHPLDAPRALTYGDKV